MRQENQRFSLSPVHVGLFNDVVSIAVINFKLDEKMIMNAVKGRDGTEKSAVCLKRSSQNLRGRTEENHETPHSLWHFLKQRLGRETKTLSQGRMDFSETGFKSSLYSAIAN
jgi:hypothetical protein